MGEQAEEGDEPGTDDQRLGDRRIADRVGIGDGAVLNEIDPADDRQPVEAFPDTGDLEPGEQETGRLGALTGRDDNEHSRSLPWSGCRRRC